MIVSRRSFIKNAAAFSITTSLLEDTVLETENLPHGQAQKYPQSEFTIKNNSVIVEDITPKNMEKMYLVIQDYPFGRVKEIESVRPYNKSKTHEFEISRRLRGIFGCYLFGRYKNKETLTLLSESDPIRFPRAERFELPHIYSGQCKEDKRVFKRTSHDGCYQIDIESNDFNIPKSAFVRKSVYYFRLKDTTYSYTDWIQSASQSYITSYLARGLSGLSENILTHSLLGLKSIFQEFGEYCYASDFSRMRLEYLPSIPEVVVNGVADCNGVANLAAATLSSEPLNYESCVVFLPLHNGIGVAKEDIKRKSQTKPQWLDEAETIPAHGKEYVYIESTGVETIGTGAIQRYNPKNIAVYSPKKGWDNRVRFAAHFPENAANKIL